MNELDKEHSGPASESGPGQASFDPSPNTEFLREKIKQKPLNRKKLLRRTLISIITAAIFGAVACLTFLLLEPLISSKLNRNDDKTDTRSSGVVSFSETSSADEITPEDMYATDSEMIEEALQGNATEVNEDIKNIEDLISNIKFGVEDYQSLYAELRDISDTLSNSLVTVTGITSGTDLLNNSYENNAQLSGLIVADNGSELLILAKNSGLTDSETINITFCNNTVCTASIKGYDATSGYVILSVLHSVISPDTLDLAVPATLGTSRSTTLKGSPIIAVGSPTGVTDSLAYGIITSGSEQLYYTDSDYTLITTDINGTENSGGVIFSLRGNVIGIIDNGFDDDPDTGLVHAVGITELKPLIEAMSNGSSKASLGIHGTDITTAMRETYDLPDGIYLDTVDMDSPAMNAGLQTGDILIAVNGTSPGNYHDLISWLYDAEPESTVNFTIRRQSVDNYISLTVPVTLGSVKYEISE